MLPHRAYALYTLCADSHAVQATAHLNMFKQALRPFPGRAAIP
jgi:hypothetical protein